MLRHVSKMSLSVYIYLVLFALHHPFSFRNKLISSHKIKNYPPVPKSSNVFPLVCSICRPAGMHFRGFVSIPIQLLDVLSASFRKTQVSSTGLLWEMRTHSHSLRSSFFLRCTSTGIHLSWRNAKVLSLWLISNQMTVYALIHAAIFKRHQ